MTNKKNSILVKKASGEMAPFSALKVRQSLLRSGASEKTADEIIDELTPQLYDGFPTRKIYRIAFSILKKKADATAARFNLKRAIMELGPSGYPFEKFVGEILKIQGYSIKTGEIVTGHCINHEIDVIAEKDNQHYMIECKYHNQQGNVSDVKVPLYIQSRFKDLETAWIKIPGHEMKFHQGWVVTNTRFTSDAIQYGNCIGLKLIGWDYPKSGSLRDQIDSLGLYPITCLTKLTKYEKQMLLDNKIVLCREICHNDKILLEVGIKPTRIKAIQQEGIQLCRKIITDDKH